MYYHSFSGTQWVPAFPPLQLLHFSSKSSDYILSKAGSDAPIIGSAIGPINDTYALQNTVLAILLLECCMSARDGATCLATREEGFKVTDRGSVTPGKRSTKTLHLYSLIASNQSAESVA